MQYSLEGGPWSLLSSFLGYILSFRLALVPGSLSLAGSLYIPIAFFVVGRVEGERCSCFAGSVLGEAVDFRLRDEGAVISGMVKKVYSLSTNDTVSIVMIIMTLYQRLIVGTRERGSSIL